MRNDAYMKNYFTKAKGEIIKKLEQLEKFYDDWMVIYDQLNISAPITYAIHPSKEHPTMNHVLAGTVGYNVICTEFEMALYNLIKQGTYKKGYESHGLKITEIELSKEVENSSSATKRYKPYFLHDIFNFEVMEKYSDKNEICIEKGENNQFSGSTSGNRGNLDIITSILQFIKYDLLPKYRGVEHTVYSGSHHIHFNEKD